MRIDIRAPFRGLNLNSADGSFSKDQGEVATNVNFTDGTIRTRPGVVSRSEPDPGALESILGIFDFIEADALEEFGLNHQVIVKTGSKIYALTGWSATEIGSSLGLSPTELASFAMVNNRVYFCDGTVFKVTDGSSVYDAPITRPGSGTALAAGAAGVLDGTYDYKVTWYSSTWGQESPASDATATLTVRFKKIELSSIPGTRPDVRVDKKRIYRRKVSAFEADWTYVGEIDHATTTFSDNVQDVDRDLLKASPLSYSDTLPKFRYLCWNMDVLFAGGSDTYPTRVYFTRPGMPWGMDQYIEVGSGHDTDRVTGLASFRGLLVIFKERSIWVLAGNSKSTFSLEKVVPGKGCRSHHSIVATDDALCFLGEDGFYAWNGSACTRIGAAVDPIGPEIRSRNVARDRYCTGVYDPTLGAIIWAYSPGGATANSKALVFFTENAKRFQTESWAIWELGNVSFIARVTDDDTKALVTAIGSATGKVFELTGSTDDGSPITTTWRSMEIDADAPELEKAWGEITVDMTKTLSTATIELRYLLDDSTSHTALVSFDPSTRAIGRSRIGRTSRKIRLEVYSSSDEAIEVNGFTLVARGAGRAI